MMMVVMTTTMSMVLLMIIMTIMCFFLSQMVVRCVKCGHDVRVRRRAKHKWRSAICICVDCWEPHCQQCVYRWHIGHMKHVSWKCHECWPFDERPWRPE